MEALILSKENTHLDRLKLTYASHTKGGVIQQNFKQKGIKAIMGALGSFLAI